LRVTIKGESVLLVRRLVEIVSELFSGREEFASLFGVLFFLAVWISVSAIAGWFLQSLIVICVHEKGKSPS